ncbi:MAG: LytR C-terminal domain-containing protein [Patescibacteria group bacterium]
MHINNPKKLKSINKEGLIYALIFVLYAAILILVFISATKFLSKAINVALSDPAGSAIEAKYGQLDLENYALIAKKLGLQKSTPANPVIILPAVILEASSTPEIATTSPELISTMIKPEITIPIIEPQIIEVKPKIVVINSTIKSGLAAQLKNKLETAGYSVIRTGNSKPSLASTVIKIKNGFNPDSNYLSEIKKIVDINYDFVLDTLADNSDYEIEIIIGNK